MSSSAARPHVPIGLQLYSVREAMDRDPVGTLARVAELGFTGVEAAGTASLTPSEFRRTLDDLGLTLISAMMGLGDDGLSDETLEFAAAVGTPRLVVNAWPHQFTSNEAIATVAASANRAASQARAAGIELGYHNHFWEFLPTDASPCPMLDLVSRLDDCFLELDIYWLRTALPDWRSTLDTLNTLSAHSGGVRIVHVKDGPATMPIPGQSADPMTPAGTGVVPIDEMLQLLPTAEWHVVEFDEYDGDIFTGIEASHRFLTARGSSVPA